MKCPRDQATLTTETREDVQVDACPTCGGVWLDPGELQQLEEAFDGDGQGAEADPVQRARDKQSDPTRCPKCGDENVREEYGFASGILVDRCPHGHGEWLDRGELEAIQTFYAQQRAGQERPWLLAFLYDLGLDVD